MAPTRDESTKQEQTAAKKQETAAKEQDAADRRAAPETLDEERKRTEGKPTLLWRTDLANMPTSQDGARFVLDTGGDEFEEVLVDTNGRLVTADGRHIDRASVKRFAVIEPTPEDQRLAGHQGMRTEAAAGRVARQQESGVRDETGALDPKHLKKEGDKK